MYTGALESVASLNQELIFESLFKLVVECTSLFEPRTQHWISVHTAALGIADLIEAQTQHWFPVLKHAFASDG